MQSSKKPEHAKSATANPRRRGRLDVDTAAKPVAEVTVPSSAKGEPSPKRGSVSTVAAKPKSTPKPKSARPKLSALNAAAQLLAVLPAKQSAEGVTTADLIEQMAKQNLWSSPAGKTPAATLYAAMMREIAAKKSASRFRRIAPGRFAAQSAPAARTPAPASRTATKRKGQA